MDVSIISKDLEGYSQKFNDFDYSVLIRYLMNRERKSHVTYRVYKPFILDFLNRFNKPFHEINDLDCEEYFNYIDAKKSESSNNPLKLSTKKQYRVYLKSFFNFYIKKYQRTFNKVILNPILDQDEYAFSRNHDKIVIELLTMDEIKENLEKSYNARYDIFILNILLTFCGMRVSEAVSIKLSDINLKERYLETGIEDSCRKSNIDGTRPLKFFFPKVVKLFLFDYISSLKYIMDNPIYLFPKKNKNSRQNHRHYQSFRYHFDKHGIYSKTHTYRKTLISHIAKKNGALDLYKAEFLTNHKISSATHQYYLKLSNQERRELYDNALDEEYNQLSEWLRKFL
jgi:integrase